MYLDKDHRQPLGRLPSTVRGAQFPFYNAHRELQKPHGFYHLPPIPAAPYLTPPSSPLEFRSPTLASYTLPAPFRSVLVVFHSIRPLLIPTFENPKTLRLI